MRLVRITVKGMSPYSASKYFAPNLLPGEDLDDHEQRRWREKAHVNDDGVVFIPGVAFKLALDTAAKKSNESISGKGTQKWQGLFASGVAVHSDMPLGIKVEDLKSVTIFAHANGKRGDGTRVMRTFPIITTWGGDVELLVLDDNIQPSIFETFFTRAGLIAGVGRGKPSSGCAQGLGRFTPTAFCWSEI
jgi:hypothetical protein